MPFAEIECMKSKSWILSLVFLMACQAPLVSSGPKGESSNPDANPLNLLGVSKSACSQAGDSDSDDDGICNSLEASGCESKKDCDGNGMDDGNELNQLKNNPAYVASSYFGSIAMAQALDDPKNPQADLASSLDRESSLEIAPIGSSNGKSLNTTAQTKSRVKLSLNGGKVVSGRAEIEIDENRGFNLFAEVTFDKDLLVNGAFLGKQIRVLQCLSLNLYQSGEVSDGELSFDRKARPPLNIANEFSSAKYCKTLGRGLYVGFVSQDGGSALVYNQIPSFSGFQAANEAGTLYSARTKLDVDPMNYSFQFRNDANQYQSRLSVPLFMTAPTRLKFSNAASDPYLRNQLDRACEYNSGKSIDIQSVELMFLPTAFSYDEAFSGLFSTEVRNENFDKSFAQAMCGDCYNQSVCQN